MCFQLKQGRKVLFSAMSPGLAAYGHHATNSDAAVRNVMGWLTLRPGDTDSEYFAAYTPEQLAFCESHAETLSCEVMYRFGED